LTVCSRVNSVTVHSSVRPRLLLEHQLLRRVRVAGPGTIALVHSPFAHHSVPPCPCTRRILLPWPGHSVYPHTAASSSPGTATHPMTVCAQYTGVPAQSRRILSTGTHPPPWPRVHRSPTGCEETIWDEVLREGHPARCGGSPPMPPCCAACEFCARICVASSFALPRGAIERALPTGVMSVWSVGLRRGNLL
jgi:hypothetical protein